MATQPIQLTPASAGSAHLEDVTARLPPDDELVVALVPLARNLRLTSDTGSVEVRQHIPAGHKLATRPVAQGDPVHRYGQFIGYATAPIAPGDHVHTHNLAVGAFHTAGRTKIASSLRWVSRDPTRALDILGQQP